MPPYTADPRKKASTEPTHTHIVHPHIEQRLAEAQETSHDSLSARTPQADHARTAQPRLGRGMVGGHTHGTALPCASLSSLGRVIVLNSCSTCMPTTRQEAAMHTVRTQMRQPCSHAHVKQHTRSLQPPHPSPNPSLPLTLPIPPPPSTQAVAQCDDGHMPPPTLCVYIHHRHIYYILCLSTQPEVEERRHT